MRRLMNEVATYYGEPATVYEALVQFPTPGDAYTLVRHLEDLARRKDAERGERQAGLPPGFLVG